MKCNFCNIDCEPNATFGSYHYNTCAKCNTQFRSHDNKLLTYWISYKSYNIEISLEHNNTLLTSNNGGYKTLLILDHMLEITPNQAQHWIERMLNLRAFL